MYAFEDRLRQKKLGHGVSSARRRNMNLIMDLKCTKKISDSFSERKVSSRKIIALGVNR